MSSRITFLMFGGAILFFVLVIFLNPVEVEFNYFFGRKLGPLPLSYLLFFSFLSGLALMLIASMISDFKRLLDGFFESRREKARERSEQHCQEGTEQMLKGNPEKAEQMFNRSIDKDKANLKAYSFLARRRRGKGFDKGAHL
jgi:uncharacterized integral membrane protein